MPIQIKIFLFIILLILFSPIIELIFSFLKFIFFGITGRDMDGKIIEKEKNKIREDKINKILR